MHKSEEKALWDALGKNTFQASLFHSELYVKFLGIFIRREYKQLNTFRFAFTSCVLFLFIIFLFAGIDNMQRKGLDIRHLFIAMQALLTLYIACFFSVIRASARWKNGIEYLSQTIVHSSYETVLPVLLFVIEKNNSPFFASGKKLSFGLYPALTRALMFADDWAPTPQETRFLQKIVLSKKLYPEELRIAALLALADQREALEDSFAKKITRLASEPGRGAVSVAAEELLAGRGKPSGQ